MIDALLARLQDRAGQSLTFAGALVTDDADLLPPEPDAVARAIPKRRAEFAAGRRAARLALNKAGLPSGAIPQGAKRAPVWPKGVTGSITHYNGLALACVAGSDRIKRLGLDLAEASDFPENLRDQILLTPQEQRQTGLEARITFSVKESVFKAFFADVGVYFGFDAVEVVPSPTAETFDVSFRRALGDYPEGFTCGGWIVMLNDRLVTWLALPA